jgi:outer membrane protein assembly factor BamB
MRLGLLALTAVALVAPARADDFAALRPTNWHHWRGPNADGTAPTADPPLTWDDTSNIKWKVPLPSKGSATPIVWGDQVFVVTATRTDRKATPDELPKRDPRFETKTSPPVHFYRFEVHSFDRDTGKLRWRQTAAERVPHEGHHPTHSYAAGSPITDGQRLFVSFGSFGNYCYDLAGKLLWERDLGRLHTRLAWGEAVNAVVHGDHLLLNWDQEADSALICLDARTGKTRWRAPRDEHTTWSTPRVVEHAGRFQVVTNGNERIRAYDLETGKELWQCGGMTVNPIPSPVAAGDVVYVMSGYRGSAARAIRLGGAGDLTDSDRILWRHDRGTPYVASPLLAGGRLYFTEERRNLFTVLDAETGRPVLDRVRLPNVTSFYASPVAAGGRIYLTSQNGTTLVLKPSDKLEVLATNRLDDVIDASPVAVGKQLFLRGEKFLYCIEEK